MHGLNIKKLAFATPTRLISIANNTGRTYDFEIYNNILDGNGTVEEGLYISGAGAGIGVIYNNKIFGCIKQNVLLSGTNFSTGIFVENNTIDGQGLVFPVQTGIYCLSALAVLKNNVCVRNNYNDIYVEGPNLPTRSGNATKDTTGDSGLTGITPATEFASLTDTDDDYLFLNDGALVGAFTRNPAGDVLKNQKILFTPSLTYVPGSAVLGRYGVAPTYATEDIAEVPRPGSSGWYSIGCHEEIYT
jgi:hypothetical protein